MDAFEEIVAGLLFREGYWVTQGFKVELTKKEKRDMGNPTCPRWEIDLVAYKPAESELLVVECKSYLDSVGVQAKHLRSEQETNGRYKLFTSTILRKAVFKRLSIQLHEAGLTHTQIKPKLALVAGKIRGNDESELLRIAKANKWKLYTPEWLVSKLNTVAGHSYQDSVADVVSKLLVRNRK